MTNAATRDLFDRRTAVYTKARALGDKEDRTPSEDSRLSGLLDELERLNRAADLATRADEATAYMSEVPESGRAPETRGGARSGASGGAAGEARYGSALAAGQKMVDLPSPFAYRGAQDGDAGTYIKSLLTGSWRGASPGLLEMRALAESGTGGFTVPTPLASQILDKARNASQVVKAGARVFPMSSDTLKAAKVLTDPVPVWRSENAAIPESDITFGPVTFDAQSLAVIVKASFEILEDVPGMNLEVERILAAAFALELDRVALFGSGASPEPRGVFNTAGVNKVAQGVNGAALTNYSALTGTAARLAGKNYTPGAYIMNPRSAAALGGLVDSTGQPLVSPAYVDQPILPTNQVPVNQVQGTSGAIASSIFQGDWSELALGIRTEFRVIALKERFADTGQVGLLAWFRGDVQVLRADAFEVVTGVL